MFSMWRNHLLLGDLAKKLKISLVENNLLVQLMLMASCIPGVYENLIISKGYGGDG